MRKLFIVAFLLICFCHHAEAQTGERLSLIVQYSPDENLSYDAERVIKFDFVKGKLVGQKILFTANLDKEGWISGIYQSRYIRTTNETIFGWRPEDEKTFDLKTGKFVDNKIFSSDKSGAKADRKAKPLRIEIKSPDGKKTVDFGNGMDVLDKLIIRVEGKPDLVINESFIVTVNSNSSIIPTLPLMWLDNERILTQKQNGSLVVVTLDGKVSPFLEIPCGSKAFPRLRQTRAGKIIYNCDGAEYRIEVSDKRFEKIKRDLDYDFSEEYLDKENVFYFKGNEIGREGIEPVTAAGYLAVTTGKRGDYGFYNASDINTIKVWNQFTKEWTILKVEGGDTEILGWYSF